MDFSEGSAQPSNAVSKSIIKDADLWDAELWDAPGSWIKSTQPFHGEENVSSYSGITIIFNRDMDAETLNSNNIKVLDGKHGERIISELFNYSYDKETRTLHITFKDPNSSYGSGNGITVIVTKEVCNSQKQEAGRSFGFGFSTQ